MVHICIRLRREATDLGDNDNFATEARLMWDAAERIQQLEAALKPFVDASEMYARNEVAKQYPDDFPTCADLKYFRNARAVLEAK